MAAVFVVIKKILNNSKIYLKNKNFSLKFLAFYENSLELFIIVTQILYDYLLPHIPNPANGLIGFIGETNVSFPHEYREFQTFYDNTFSTITGFIGVLR